MANFSMRPCEHCRNPHKQLYRTQCMYDGDGYLPCTEDALRARDDRRCATVAVVFAVAVLIAAFVFLHHAISS